MTEQQPPAQGAGDAGETPPAAPARHGPPVVEAEEILTERGEENAKLLAGVLGDLATATGGRDDLPWARVASENLVEAARRCRDDASLGMDLLHLLLAVDYEDHIELDYVLFSIPNDRKAILKVDLPAATPAINTVTGLWAAASWFERETHDLFGVTFTGNPDQSPLLLYEGFEGHPGLRSYPFNDYQEW